MDEDIINAVVKNTEQTFLTMANLSVQHEKNLEKDKMNNLPETGVYMDIDDHGQTVGRIALYMTPEFVEKVYEASLGANMEQDNEKDSTAGEFLNMITGGVKNVFLKKKPGLSFSFPLPLKAGRDSIQDVEGEDVFISFSCEGSLFFIEVIFQA